MAKALIKKGDKVTNYIIVNNGYCELKAQFTGWQDSIITEIQFELTDKVEAHFIKDVHYCKKHNRLEIHVFKGTTVRSSFTASESHLKNISLDIDEERILDFIDYIKDENPKIHNCFIPEVGVGIHPEVKKGNILRGILNEIS